MPMSTERRQNDNNERGVICHVHVHRCHRNPLPAKPLCFGVAAALSGCQSSGGCGSAGAALPGQEGSGVRLEKGSDNQHVVEGGIWKGVVVGGLRRLPWPPSETTSLTPAEVPWRHSLQGWMLSCSGEEEDASTKATKMAAGMSQEQALDGVMRAGWGRWRMR